MPYRILRAHWKERGGIASDALHVPSLNAITWQARQQSLIQTSLQFFGTTVDLGV